MFPSLSEMPKTPIHKSAKSAEIATDAEIAVLAEITEIAGFTEKKRNCLSTKIIEISETAETVEIGHSAEIADNADFWRDF